MTASTSNHSRPTHSQPLAVISGGSRGLGLLVAKELAQRGYNLALLARTSAELQDAAQQISQEFPQQEVLPYVCDVSDRAAVVESVERIENMQGPIEVLINVAGIIQVGPAENVTEDLFDQAIGSMLLGPINLTWAVLRFMRQRNRGHIGVVSSIGGSIAVPHLLPYSTAKFGALGFSEGLSTELAGTDISVTTIIPGLMRTGSHERAQFIGKRDQEYAWFAPGASLPLISIKAETAATRIVEGTLAGKTHVILTPIAKIGMRVHGLAPQLVVKGLGVVAKMMPHASSDQDASEPREGRELGGLRKSLPLKAITALGKRASKKNLEHPER